jgi:hypothetical protein
MMRPQQLGQGANHQLNLPIQLRPRRLGECRVTRQARIVDEKVDVPIQLAEVCHHNGGGICTGQVS